MIVSLLGMHRFPIQVPRVTAAVTVNQVPLEPLDPRLVLVCNRCERESQTYLSVG